MAFAFRSKPDAGAIVQPKPPASWLFLGHFQPLSPPNPGKSALFVRHGLS